MTPPAWEKEALQIGLTNDQLPALKALLEDREAWRESDELKAFFEAAAALGTADYLEYDPTVIRGLDYYTGTVFEARDAAGEYRAILGGGRYDDLVADVGGDPVPAVGFAMGDVVIGLVIEKYGTKPDLRTDPADVLVTTFEGQNPAESLRIAGELRQAGLKAEWYPQGERLPKQLKFADRQGIPLIVIQGPDEAAANEVTLKDLRRREQVRLPRGELAARVRALLERDPAA
jgi:histidyl-tRNA synthetase